MLEYCAHYGFTLGRVFSDIHKSGTKDAREQFREMISLAEHSQKPDGILLWSFARFARNELDANYYKSMLRKSGIILYSLINDIPEGKYATVMEALVHISDQEKAEQAAFESRRGLRSIVKQGAMPGRPPRGILRQPLTVTSDDGTVRTLHRWVPDPEVAPRVRQAFEMRASGASLAAIHAQVGLYGSLNSYTTFFTNKIYAGILEFGDETIENYCEAIVPLDIFNAVQAISKDYAARKNVSANSINHPRRKNSSLLLAGLARCARCGSPLVGHNSPHHGPFSATISYRCNRKKRNKDCDLPNIPAKPAEQAVINALAELANSPAIIQGMEESARQEAKNAEQTRQEKAAVLQAELKRIRLQITNTTNAIADIGSSRALIEKLTALELERDRRELQQRELTQQTTHTPADPATIQAMLQNISAALKTQALPQQQLLLRALLRQIDVDRDGKTLMIGLIIKVPKKKPDIICVPTSIPSVGAPTYRHTITAQIKRRPRSQEIGRAHV
jgi:DNA invertase Pin-like site-specific DNA recombinase